MQILHQEASLAPIGTTIGISAYINLQSQKETKKNCRLES